MDKTEQSLLDLCSQASLPELHSLVEELHYRREANGADLADYPTQARLKALIHLIYRHGQPQNNVGAADRGLLRALKKAGSKLQDPGPSGLLREILRSFSASWPELLTLFWALLSMSGVEGVLGAKLSETQGYLQFNRLLYLLFLGRIAQRRGGEKRKDQFLYSDHKLRELVSARPDLAEIYEQLRTCPREQRSKQIPLLPVASEKWLLSPELVYDDLLENYVTVMDAYVQGSAAGKVAEGHSPKGAYIPRGKTRGPFND